MSDNSTVSQRFKPQLKKKKKREKESERERSLLGLFVAVMEFSMLCTYVINIFSFLSIPQAEPVGKKPLWAGLGKQRCHETLQELLAVG